MSVTRRSIITFTVTEDDTSYPINLEEHVFVTYSIEGHVWIVTSETQPRWVGRAQNREAAILAFLMSRLDCEPEA